MLSLTKPELSHEAVYEVARERFIDVSYVKRLESGQQDVVKACQDYDWLGESGRLFEAVKPEHVAPHILAGDMQRLYSKGLLRKNSDARKIYERLRVSSPFRVCPLCLHRPVKTLDHYLPKEVYAPFAVHPSNLIPCCRDCNSEKLSFDPVLRSEMLLHPYFDNVDGTEWLGCDLDHQKHGWNVTFYVRAANVDNDLKDRLIKHMTVLDLFQLYDIEASREISESRYQIARSFASGGVEAVRQLCLDMALSRSVLAQNYWRTVLWNAAASNKDFCEAGWVT